MKTRALIILIVFLWCTVFTQSSGCKEADQRKSAVPVRDINTIKEAHVNQLMSLPGVAGVYVGELEDHTPCIVVAVLKKTPELDQKIPKSLEDHPVRIDETGEINPMK